MSDRLEERVEFLLPSEFLTEEDILMDTKNGEKLSETDFCLPTEFPYELDSVANSSDEEDQLTELTRQLTLQRTHKPNVEMKSRWVIARSPQSTLMGSWVGQSPGSSNGGTPNGSSQVSSPPNTPLGANNNAFDLIHQAAGQVALLKMNGRDAPFPKDGTHHGLGHSNAFYNTYVHQVRDEQMLTQQQSSAMWCNGRVINGFICETPPPPENMAQNPGSIRFGALMVSENCQRRAQAAGAGAAWRYVQQKSEKNRSVTRGAAFMGGGSGNVGGVKRQCAGTGVFLPRPYANNNNQPAESCKKPTGGSTSVLPARVVHDLNRNFNDMNGRLFQPQHLPHFNGGYIVDYEMLMARRNASLMQQRQNLRSQVAINHEIRLPQEWTY